MTTTITSAADLDSSATVTLRADEEYAAEAWWDAARTAMREGGAGLSIAQRDAVRRLLTNALRGVELARADAESITVWAAALPGYSDGPAYAPTALLICES